MLEEDAQIVASPGDATPGRAATEGGADDLGAAGPRPRPAYEAGVLASLDAAGN